MFVSLIGHFLLEAKLLLFAYPTPIINIFPHAPLLLHRHFGTCGVLAARRASLPQNLGAPISSPSRGFISLAAPVSSRRMEYTECQTLE